VNRGKKVLRPRVGEARERKNRWRIDNQRGKKKGGKGRDLPHSLRESRLTMSPVRMVRNRGKTTESKAFSTEGGGEKRSNSSGKKSPHHTAGLSCRTRMKRRRSHSVLHGTEGNLGKSARLGSPKPVFAALAHRPVGESRKMLRGRLDSLAFGVLHKPRKHECNQRLTKERESPGVEAGGPRKRESQFP